MAQSSSNPSSCTPSHNLKPGRRRTFAPRCSLTFLLLALLALCSMPEAMAIGNGALSARQELGQTVPFKIVLRSDGETDLLALHWLEDGQEPIKRAPSSTAPVPTSIQTAIFPTFPANTTATPGDSATATGTDSSASTTTSALTRETVYPLPRPFDNSLGSNFTASSCPTFFSDFLSNPTFTTCLPLSLLLRTSNSFFQSESSLARITQTLDATCNVVFPTCNALMSSLALQLRDNANCGADYALQNPLVLQAYTAFLAYEPVYQAGCLKASTDANTGSSEYCFATAVTNLSNPASAYVYYLALGTPLPPTNPNAKTLSTPTCNTCLQTTMGYFADAAANLTQPVSQTYVAAAQSINQACGADFVAGNVSVIAGSAPTSGAARLGVGGAGAGASTLLWAAIVSIAVGMPMVM
jgi:hypothetical protein